MEARWEFHANKMDGRKLVIWGTGDDAPHVVKSIQKMETPCGGGGLSFLYPVIMRKRLFLWISPYSAKWH
jgi:hypothetical protein